MKKIIALFFAAIGTWGVSQAQCTVSALAVQLHSVTVTGNECIANFDLSWQQEINSGNKFAVLHLWRTDQYPALEANSLAYMSSSDHPDETDLALALANIIIEDNGTASPFIGSTYYPHPAVPVLSSGLSVHKEVIDANWERMTIKNITLTINNCSGTSITGDIWASQANHGQSVHCVSSGISMIIGNPLVSGSMNCVIPHQYELSVVNKDTVAINITYDAYIDEGDAIYEPVVHDLRITAVSQGPFTIAPGATYNSGPLSYLPWSGVKPYADRGIWIEVDIVGFPNKAIYLINNPCFPLAANFTSFAGVFTRQGVNLTWTTSAEVNSYGFEVQRGTGNGQFETIAFVPSKAVNGNSASPLSYSYIDPNPGKHITEYRLKQVDLDAKFKFSQVIIVRSQERFDYAIYPNPATNSTVNLFFNNQVTHYDIELLDISGRRVRYYGNVSGQKLEISNIPQGMYVLRVFDKVKGIVSAERLSVYR